MTEAMNQAWRRRIFSVIAMAFFLVVVVFSVGNRFAVRVAEHSADYWLQQILYFGDGLLWNGIAVVLIASVLIQRRRAVTVAKIGCGILAFHVAMRATSLATGATTGLVYRLDAESTIALGCIEVIMLLLLPRLDKAGRRFQAVGVGAVVGTLVVWSLMYLDMVSFARDVLVWVRLVLVLAALVSVVAVAWLGVFRPEIAAHDPPADAGKAVQLTCPRCHTLQTVATGGGACGHCRLGIFIALKEGACGTCGYLLRGLESGACPECGTAVIEAGIGREAGGA